MRNLSVSVRLAAFAAAIASLIVTFMLGVRPWFLNWGASAHDAQRSLVGDELLSGVRPDDQATRVITIRAPAQQVWPWLLQLGQDRAGFYSYELLEDLVGCRMPHTDRIHPEFQERKVGDKLWMYPPDRWDGRGHALLMRYEPGQAMVFGTRQFGTDQDKPHDGTWAFIVEPIDSESSRLIVRSRAAGERGFWAGAFDTLLFDPVHFVMERRMMEGIKRFAQGGQTSIVRDNLQILTWLIAWLLSLISAVLVFRRASWARPMLGFMTACVVFQILTLAQPSPLVGFVLLLGVTAILSERFPNPFRAPPSARHVHARR